jgi:hypothetical protein
MFVTFFNPSASSPDRPQGYWHGGYRIVDEREPKKTLTRVMTYEVENCFEEAVCKKGSWKGVSRIWSWVDDLSLEFVKDGECEEFAIAWNSVCAYAKKYNA